VATESVESQRRRRGAGRNLPAAIGVGLVLGGLVIGTLFTFRFGFVVLLLGLLLTGGLYTAFSPAQADQAAASDEQIAQGRELFLVGCAFCHGQNGEGVRTIDSKGGDIRIRKKNRCKHKK